MPYSNQGKPSDMSNILQGDDSNDYLNTSLNSTAPSDFSIPVGGQHNNINSNPNMDSHNNGDHDISGNFNPFGGLPNVTSGQDTLDNSDYTRQTGSLQGSKHVDENFQTGDVANDPAIHDSKTPIPGMVRQTAPILGGKRADEPEDNRVGIDPSQDKDHIAIINRETVVESATVPEHLKDSKTLELDESSTNTRLYNNASVTEHQINVKHPTRTCFKLAYPQPLELNDPSVFIVGLEYIGFKYLIMSGTTCFILGRFHTGLLVFLIASATCVAAFYMLSNKALESLLWQVEKLNGAKRLSPKEQGESLEWLNIMIEKVWRCVDPQIFSSVEDILEDTLSRVAPTKLIKAIRVGDFDLGTLSPRIENMQIYPPTAKQLPNVIFGEAAFSLREDVSSNLKHRHSTPPGVSIRFKTTINAPVDVRGELTKLTGKIRFKIITAPEIPFVSKVTISFPTVPTIETAVMPVTQKLNIMRLPVIKALVDEGVKLGFAQLVDPKSITIDVDQLFGAQSNVEAMGVIKTQIREMKRDNPGMKDPTFSYVTVSLSNRKKDDVKTTRVLANKANPSWNENLFQLITLDEAKEEVYLNIKLWQADKIGSDHLCGSVSVNVKDIILGTEDEFGNIGQWCKDERVMFDGWAPIDGKTGVESNIRLNFKLSFHPKYEIPDIKALRPRTESAKKEKEKKKELKEVREEKAKEKKRQQKLLKEKLNDQKNPLIKKAPLLLNEDGQVNAPTNNRVHILDILQNADVPTKSEQKRESSMPDMLEAMVNTIAPNRTEKKDDNASELNSSTDSLNIEDSSETTTKDGHEIKNIKKDNQQSAINNTSALKADNIAMASDDDSDVGKTELIGLYDDTVESNTSGTDTHEGDDVDDNSDVEGDPVSSNHKSGVLTVTIVEAKDLTIMNPSMMSSDKRRHPYNHNQTVDPYALLYVNGSKIFRTRSKMRMPNPNWNAMAEAFIPNYDTAYLSVSVKTSMDLEQDPVIGIAFFRISEIFTSKSQKHKEASRWVPLFNGIGNGKILLQIQYKPIKLELPRNLSGANVGTLVLESIRMDGINPTFANSNELSYMKVKFGLNEEPTITKELNSSHLEQDSLGEWGWYKDHIYLPVMTRYKDALFIHLQRPTHRKATACIWLKELYDIDSQVVKLALREYVNEHSNEANQNENCWGEEGIFGSITVRVKFIPGFSPVHSHLQVFATDMLGADPFHNDILFDKAHLLVRKEGSEFYSIDNSPLTKEERDKRQVLMDRISASTGEKHHKWSPATLIKDKETQKRKLVQKNCETIKKQLDTDRNAKPDEEVAASTSDRRRENSDKFDLQDDGIIDVGATDPNTSKLDQVREIQTTDYLDEMKDELSNSRIHKHKITRKMSRGKDELLQKVGSITRGHNNSNTEREKKTVAEEV